MNPGPSSVKIDTKPSHYHLSWGHGHHPDESISMPRNPVEIIVLVPRREGRSWCREPRRLGGLNHTIIVKGQEDLDPDPA